MGHTICEASAKENSPGEVTRCEPPKKLQQTCSTLTPDHLYVNILGGNSKQNVRIFFSLKNIEITTKHLILCSSINKRLRKTLITTKQARETTGGENQSLKSLDNLEGPFENAGFWVGNIGYVTAKIT